MRRKWPNRDSDRVLGFALALQQVVSNHKWGDTWHIACQCVRMLTASLLLIFCVCVCVYHVNRIYMRRVAYVCAHVSVSKNQTDNEMRHLVYRRLHFGQHNNPSTVYSFTKAPFFFSRFIFSAPPVWSWWLQYRRINVQLIQFRHVSTLYYD